MYIKSIRLRNVQSFQDQTLEFSEGLNIIKADSNSEGKSVLFKILRESMTPGYWGQRAVKQLIRWGATSATLTITFSDESIWWFVLAPTYKQYFQEINGKAENVTGEPPQEYLENMSCISHEKYIANMLTTSSDLLFIESGGSNDKALLALLTTHQTMEDVRDTIAEDVTEKKRYLTACERRQENVLNTMREYNLGDLEGAKKKEYDLLHIPKGIETFFRFMSLEKQIVSKNKLGAVASELGHLVGGIKVVSTIDNMIPNMATLRNEVKELEPIVDGLKALEKMCNIKPIRDDSFIEYIEHVNKGLTVLNSFGRVNVQESNTELLGHLEKGIGLLVAVSKVKYIEEPKFDDMSMTIQAMKTVGRLYKRVPRIFSYKMNARQNLLQLENIQKYLDTNASKAVCPFYGKEVYYSQTGCKEVNS